VASRTNNAAVWDQRIARARELTREHPSAREPLTFYARLAEYQRSLFLGAGACRSESDFVDAVDLTSASAAVPDFLAWLERTAPAPLALTVHTIRGERTGTDWPRLMRECLKQPDPASARVEEVAKAFVVEAVLQPYAEAAALDRREKRGRHPNGLGALTARCPICSGSPCVGILREEGQGAKRTLLCARCLTEWEYLRVVCPSCGEERFDALPVYTADASPYVRIDACDTCRTYLKTIDLTRNGLAVPLVDDIASVALDLWAVEQGYRRLRANLLRTSEPARRRPLA